MTGRSTGDPMLVATKIVYVMFSMFLFVMSVNSALTVIFTSLNLLLSLYLFVTFHSHDDD